MDLKSSSIATELHDSHVHASNSPGREDVSYRATPPDDYTKLQAAWKNVTSRFRQQDGLLRNITCRDLALRTRPLTRLCSGMNMIDCSTRRIVPAQDSYYAALSWVWDCPVIGSDVESEFQVTVEDAIIATRRLGLCYLWIDRYCINQSDKSERDGYLRLMPQIYRNANVTLIAASKAQGFAGMSRPCCVSDEEREIRSPQPLGTRCWVRQERSLSKGRVMFTDQGNLVLLALD